MFVDTLNINRMITRDDSIDEALPAKAAFCRLYREYYAKIYRYAFRFTGDQYEAEDVTQETFIKLDDFLSRMHPDDTVPGYIGAWLYRVTSNLCCNLVKRRSKYRDILTGMEKNHKSAPDVESQYIEAEKQQHVRTALARLSNRDRVLLMLYQDGMSYAEMAEVIKVKKTSIGKLLSRAVERCSRHIEDLMPGTKRKGKNGD